MTDHTSQGASRVASTDDFADSASSSGAVRRSRAWSTDRLPINNTDGITAGERMAENPFLGGVACELLELTPGAETPSVTTGSIDYAVILEGELELVLEGSPPTRLKAGDVLVQRGGAHV